MIDLRNSHSKEFFFSEMDLSYLNLIKCRVHVVVNVTWLNEFLLEEQIFMQCTYYTKDFAQATTLIIILTSYLLSKY